MIENFSLLPLNDSILFYIFSRPLNEACSNWTLTFDLKFAPKNDTEGCLEHRFLNSSNDIYLHSRRQIKIISSSNKPSTKRLLDEKTNITYNYIGEGCYMVYLYVLNGDVPHSNSTHGPVVVNNTFDAKTIFKINTDFEEIDQ